MTDYMNKDEWVRTCGTEEQKKDLQSREERLKSWLESLDIPVLNSEEQIKKFMENEYDYLSNRIQSVGRRF